MRLSPKEVAAIKTAFADLFPHETYSLYLFGSRVHDDRKGGDIDLLLVTTTASREIFINSKAKVRLKIFETIPEQRIDITVATPEELQTDTFLQSIQDELIKL